MSKSTKDYLYSVKIAEQVDAVPFLGDLYNSTDEEFYPVEKKRLVVKSLKVSADKFIGEVILADVDWSQAPKNYDKVVVGVEVAVPRPGKKPLPGSWTLADTNGKVRDSFEFNVDISPGNTRVTTYYFQSLNTLKTKPTKGRNPRCECSFERSLNDVTNFIELIKNTTEDIIARSDIEKLQNVYDNTKQLSVELNYLVQDWIRNLTSDNWARFTYFLIKQCDLVEDYVKYSNSEICRVEKTYKEKRGLVDLFNKESIEYVNSKEQWLHIIGNNPEVYALMFYEKLMLTNAKVVAFFRDFKDRGDGKGSVFCAVDLDIVDHSAFEAPPPNLIQIQRYIRGECETPDLMASQRTTRCNVASYDGEWERLVPKKRTLLKAVCPGNYSRLNCQAVVRDWLCEACELPLYYAYEDGIFCDHCGAGAVREFSYRCDSYEHDDPTPMTAKQIRELEDLLPMAEINILILGQSGVGKSTWVNATCNYMSFKTLENAELFEVKAPIPSKFVIVDNKMQQRTVCIGDDENENQNVGESATQDCRSYSVVLDNMVINLMDTPGLGDSRGLEEDKKNIKKVLDFVRHVDVLHGICLLLKPNETRLTVLLSYCLKEILSNLHQSASRNLIFCFTNARQTFYRPGETLPILKQLLEGIGVNLLLDDRIFCLDNEAFRYLCSRGIKDIDYSQEDQESFAKSWKKSVDETTRLLQRVSTLDPHRTHDTVSLNHARRIILSLARPIGNITQVVEANLNELRAKQADVEGSRMSIDQLRGKVLIPTYRMKTIKFDPDHPRTVCVAHKCAERVPVGRGGATQTLYKTHCHPHCYLQHVQAETHPNPDLKGCAAMNGTLSCYVCGCSWETHMHIHYEQTMEEVLEEDVTVTNRLRLATTQAEIKKVIVDDCIKRMKENEDEKKQILRIASYFTNFLRENAIAAYNDSIGDYLDFLLSIENEKQNKTPNDISKINNMKETKILYEHEVMMFQEGSKHRTRKMTAGDIKNYEQELYDLPIYGNQLREAMEIALKSEDAAAKNNIKVITSKAKPKEKIGLINKITTGISNIWKGPEKNYSHNHNNYNQNRGRGKNRGARGNRNKRR